MEQQKELLKIKINANKQRNQRKQLLHLFPAPHAMVLNQATYLLSPVRDDMIQTVMQRWNNQLYNYHFRFQYPQFVKAFSWEKDVIMYVQELTMEEQDVYLYFGMSDSPIFVVDGQWVLENFATLWQLIAYEDIWVIDKEFDKGIVVSNFAGYLTEDPNPAEVYYEVLTWGL
jgi:hypothetical protein